MKVDFHSHILPDVDDGAGNVEIALKMLEASMSAGVTDIVSTSHCYPYSNHDILSFLRHRAAGYDAVLTEAQKKGIDLPNIYLGSEVHLTCDITEFRDIRRLCIKDTDYMLIEMPPHPWTDDLIDVVYKLTISGIKPIIAHQDRNLGQKSEMLRALYDLDILIQMNADCFGESSVKKQIDLMMKNELIHVIGSDMHNMGHRRPNMEKAEKYIVKRYGNACWEYLMNNAKRVLDGEEISYHDMISFGKKSIFGTKKQKH